MSLKLKIKQKLSEKEYRRVVEVEKRGIVAGLEYSVVYPMIILFIIEVFVWVYISGAKDFTSKILLTMIGSVSMLIIGVLGYQIFDEVIRGKKLEKYLEKKYKNI